MEWEIGLEKHSSLLQEKDYKEIYAVCLNAYAEGLAKEKERALEAYRQRCENLFGNKCMSPYLPAGIRNKTCDGNCYYLLKFQAELNRLDDEPSGCAL